MVYINAIGYISVGNEHIQQLNRNPDLILIGHEREERLDSFIRR